MWDNHQLLRLISNVLMTLAVLMLGAAALVWVVHAPVFTVKRIEISGQLKKVTPVQLRYIASHELKGTFFLVDINATRAAFEKLPWVAEAEVRRRWPDTLEIKLREHVALARWGERGMIAQDGKWFDAAGEAGLPVLVGPAGSNEDMAKMYRELQRALRPTGLSITALNLSARRAWQVGLNNQVHLELGRQLVLERAERFSGYWLGTLAALPQKIETVDLRYPNGFAVRLADFKGLPPRKTHKTTGA